MICSSVANCAFMNENCAPSSNKIFAKVLIFPALTVAVAVFSKQVVNVWGL